MKKARHTGGLKSATTADFVYLEAGQETVEDVKAYDERKKAYLTTAAFNLKWKSITFLMPS